MSEVSIDVLRKNYYDGIANLTDEKDIRTFLPSPEFTNFYPIVSGLLDKLVVKQQKLVEFLNDETDEEYREIYYEELSLVDLKIKICKERLLEASKIEEEEKTADNEESKKIVFALTSSGKSYIEQDLKNIPEEYYPEIFDCFKDIENGRKEENGEISRAFNTNNKKLKGMHEIKRFKIRLVYQILDKNVIYVMIVRQKKADNDSVDREELINRKKATTEEFENLRFMINNNQLPDEY